MLITLTSTSESKSRFRFLNTDVSTWAGPLCTPHAQWMSKRSVPSTLASTTIEGSPVDYLRHPQGVWQKLWMDQYSSAVLGVGSQFKGIWNHPASSSANQMQVHTQKPLIPSPHVYNCKSQPGMNPNPCFHSQLQSWWKDGKTQQGAKSIKGILVKYNGIYLVREDPQEC